MCINFLECYQLINDKCLAKTMSSWDIAIILSQVENHHKKIYVCIIVSLDVFFFSIFFCLFFFLSI